MTKDDDDLTRGVGERSADRQDLPRPVSEVASASAEHMVAGVCMDRSIVDFQRSCAVHIAEEQRKPNPDTALIALLCDAVRCSRELSRAPVLSVTGADSRMADAAEMLWVVLANVSGGDWKQQTQEWRDAAARWRDYYFRALVERPTSPPSPAAVDPQLGGVDAGPRATDRPSLPSSESSP